MLLVMVISSITMENGHLRTLSTVLSREVVLGAIITVDNGHLERLSSVLSREVVLGAIITVENGSLNPRLHGGF